MQTVLIVISLLALSGSPAKIEIIEKIDGVGGCSFLNYLRIGKIDNKELFNFQTYFSLWKDPTHQLSFSKFVGRPKIN